MVRKCWGLIFKQLSMLTLLIFTMQEFHQFLPCVLIIWWVEIWALRNRNNYFYFTKKVKNLDEGITKVASYKVVTQTFSSKSPFPYSTSLSSYCSLRTLAEVQFLFFFFSLFIFLFFPFSFPVKRGMWFSGLAFTYFLSSSLKNWKRSKQSIHTQIRVLASSSHLPGGADQFSKGNQVLLHLGDDCWKPKLMYKV